MSASVRGTLITPHTNKFALRTQRTRCPSSVPTLPIAIKTQEFLKGALDNQNGQENAGLRAECLGEGVRKPLRTEAEMGLLGL